MYYAVLSADQVHNNKDLLSQGWESLSYVRTGMVTSEFDCTHWNAKCFFFYSSCAEHKGIVQAIYKELTQAVYTDVIYLDTVEHA